MVCLVLGLAGGANRDRISFPPPAANFSNLWRSAGANVVRMERFWNSSTPLMITFCGGISSPWRLPWGSNMKSSPLWKKRIAATLPLR